MRLAPLTLHDKPQWASLMALAFDRTVPDMLRLLDWLHHGHTVIGWGAWDGDKLAAQYNCAMMHITQGDGTTVPVGMSINMAVDPAYRGRGLIKQVSQPVYAAVEAHGGVSGIGFSNKQGVKVDLNSKHYGYQVIGRMQSAVVWLTGQKHPALRLTDQWPDTPFAEATVRHPRYGFASSPASLEHRFAHHPFRQYQFGVWQDSGMVQGIVIYRDIHVGGVKGVSLLAAYGASLDELLGRWGAAIRQRGAHFIHLLMTPQSELHSYLSGLGFTSLLPYSRSPYYLTVKPFAHTPRSFLDFASWDCLGGDIL